MEFMADVADKFLADIFQFLQSGHFVKDKYLALLHSGPDR